MSSNFITEDDTSYEIYTDDSGAFSVGMICAQNDSDILFAGVDEEGKISAYYALPRKVILEMCTDTEYLARIRQYMRYAQQHSYAAWFSLPQIDVDPDKPIMSQLLRMAHKEGEPVTLSRVGDDEILCGYVRELAGGRVSLDTIDPVSADNMPQVKIKVRDLEYVEYKSLANTLLAFANRELAR